jgi:EAL domain-containing protein (putative c-di-GMP-specific phosphodiesterase class I)
VPLPNDFTVLSDDKYAMNELEEVKKELDPEEMSADILFEDVALAQERIAELHALGVKIAIGELGDEFCPVFRLASFQFEYAFLDSYAIEHLLDDNAAQSVGALVAYLHTLHARVVAPELTDEAQSHRARELGCDGYTLLEKGGDAV